MRIHTPADLQRFLNENAIDAHLVSEIGDTPTVAAAAAALGVPSQRIVKTLLFLVKTPAQTEPQRVVVISNGESRVDKRAIAAHYGVGRKRVKLAPPAEVIEQLGYGVGGVPPFGHRARHPVLLDQAVFNLGTGATIYGGGGDDQTMLALSVDELMRMVQPQAVLPLSEEP